MAVNFANNIDLLKNQILNVVVQKLAADPTGPAEGQIYFNTTIGRLKLYTGGAWLILEASTGSSTTITDIVAGNQIAVTITGGIATVAHGTISGASNTNFTGASVLASLTFSNGHVTGVTTRNLTLADLGYTGATDADKYTNWQIGASTGTTQNVTANQLVRILQGSGTTAAIGANREITIGVDGTVVRTTGNQTIGGTKTFSNDVVVEGNLTVNGTTTTVNSQTVEIADSLLLLNKNQPDVAPSVDAGFVAKRGTQSNVAWAWVESLGAFVAREVGTFSGNTGVLPTTGGFAGIIAGTSLFDALGIEAVGNGNVPTNFLVWNPTTKEVLEVTPAQLWAAVKVTATTSVEGLVELATDAETLALTASNRAVTPSNLAALTFKQDIGNGTATSITVTHNFNTLDVEVTVFDNVSGDRVYTGEKRTANTVVFGFGTAPATNQYRVLIRKV
jgi:hypothetical protein